MFVQYTLKWKEMCILTLEVLCIYIYAWCVLWHSWVLENCISKFHPWLPVTPAAPQALGILESQKIWDTMVFLFFSFLILSLVKLNLNMGLVLTSREKMTIYTVIWRCVLSNVRLICMVLIFAECLVNWNWKTIFFSSIES